MASSDIYQRFPALLSAELADLDLPPEDASVREALNVIYHGERKRLHEIAVLDREWAAAQADAKRLQKGGR